MSTQVRNCLFIQLLNCYCAFTREADQNSAKKGTGKEYCTICSMVISSLNLVSPAGFLGQNLDIETPSCMTMTQVSIVGLVVYKSNLLNGDITIRPG